MRFKKTLAAAAVLCGCGVVQSKDWPTNVADVGCTFHLTETVGAWSSTQVLTITEHLPFPSMRIKTERVKSRADDGEKTSSMSDLLAASGTQKTIDGSVHDSLFCSDICAAREGTFAQEHRALFPLVVGNTAKIPALSTVNLEVTGQRSSPYISNTQEFQIQATVDLLGDGSTLVPGYKVWWNTGLGFFTEREIIRNQVHQKLTDWSCPAS